MSIQRLLTQPLTVQSVEGTTTDEYGNTVPTPVGSPVPTLGYLEQKDTIEYLTDRQTVVSKWKAFLPATTAVGPMDYINFESQKFQVDGEPEHLWNPRTKSVSHIECKLTVAT
jgi:hypothetical protein